MHNDPLGTPQVLTDKNGKKVWTAQYDPFGKATVNEDPDNDGNSVTLNVRFPGQYYDKETGLHYNGYRYYSPETGRYLTSDPIGLRGGLNTYMYVSNNPENVADPTGLSGQIGFGDGGSLGFAGAIDLFRGFGFGGGFGIETRKCCGADGNLYRELFAVATAGISFGKSSRLSPSGLVNLVRVGNLPPCLTKSSSGFDGRTLTIQVVGATVSSTFNGIHVKRGTIGLSPGGGASAVLSLFTAVKPIGKTRLSGTCSCNQ